MTVDGAETNCLEALGGTCDADYECSYAVPAPSQQSGGATVASLAASTLAALAAANL